jgi:hypothetical protein
MERIMNASEAAAAAKKIREDRATERKKSQKRHDRKAAADWRKERADFLIEFRKDMEHSIAGAVKAGKNSVKVDGLASTWGCQSPVQAEESYKVSPLRDLVEKVFASFRGKGFSIKTFVSNHEHYVNYETSSDMYYTYAMSATVSWK